MHPAPNTQNLYALVISLLALLVNPGTGLADSAVVHAPLRVVASVHPLRLLAEAVGGPFIDVETLLPTNRSPHDFALRMSDMQGLEQADLVIWSSVVLEPYMRKPLTVLGSVSAVSDQPGGPVALELFPLAKCPAPSPDTAVDPHSRCLSNPHLWLDPDHLLQAARALSATLIALLPDQRDALEARLARFSEDLARLGGELSALLAPVRNSRFVVIHEAYSPFGDAFGLNLHQALVDEHGNRGGARHRHLWLEAARAGTVDCVIVGVSAEEIKLQASLGLSAVKHITLDPLGQQETDILAWYRHIGEALASCQQQSAVN